MICGSGSSSLLTRSGLSKIFVEMAKNSPKVAKMAKQNENARFRQNGQKSAKMAKILQNEIIE